MFDIASMKAFVNTDRKIVSEIEFKGVTLFYIELIIIHSKLKLPLSEKIAPGWFSFFFFKRNNSVMGCVSLYV